MNRIVLFTFLFLIILPNSFSQKAIQGNKWETVDVLFTLNGNIEKPFHVDLSYTFKAPDNSQVTVPGFNNGNNEWLVRFNPNQEGTSTSISSFSLKKLPIQWFNPLTIIYTEPHEVDFKSRMVLNPEFEGIDNVIIVKLINRKK
ncbi:DUF5060 domain-containing protein [Formosa sp. PL04]|uniref:DUF5060 domain-containing protein n=1 Tax=Formosa sp. PL04 TaxID=3081755 RepID=UPI002981205B|nr:DUF5060 domain-containing protein [Formosa sp. PL04]MDW5290259.1 DUF5060 domain-containing protein [Formosa sp. PL04]